jgi:hypothetical protein
MRLGHRSAESGERKIESVERIRRSMGLIESQIQSSLPLTFEEDGETTRYFAGEKKALTIATNYSLWAGGKGYIIAEYTVRENPSGKEDLYVSERTVGTEAKTETVLLRDLDAIEFFYLDRGLSEEDKKWVEDWTDEEKEPDRVMVRVKQKAWDYSLVIPIRVGGET